MRVVVERFAAWAPEHENEAQWRAWAIDPRPLPASGQPDASFLPALLRRRCTPLTRAVLKAAFDCCEGTNLGSARTVFASRHGSINESLSLLEAVARDSTLSPARFSHTVHNAQAGLFSIAAENRQASSSLAAGEQSFAAGFLEALTFLERAPDVPVLYVMGDVPLADTFAPLVDEPTTSYSLALLLQRPPRPLEDRGGRELELSLGEGSPRAEPARWPDALEFLRFLVLDEPELELRYDSRSWLWKRC